MKQVFTWPLAAVVFSGSLLGGCGSSGSGSDDTGPPPLTVSKVASCAGGDTPETALQGQVPAALRQSGYTGFNCNLKLVGQYQGEGGNWSSATYTDASGRSCAYHSTAAPNAADGSPIPGRQTPGVPVIDMSDRSKPVRVTSLTTPGMLDPWESLRINYRRQILAAGNAQNGGISGGPEVDIYDVSGDCRSPQLLASVKVGVGTDGGIVAEKMPRGHEGNFAPDGLTYYIGDLRNDTYHAVDITNTTKPKLISTFDMKKGPFPAGRPHGLSITNDGNRAYAVSLYFPPAGEVSDPNAKLQNGFYILDTSEVQARKPNAQMKVISTVAFKDGSIAQHTIPITVAGKQYLVMVDEGGSGGLADPQNVNLKAACAAGLAPFPMARIFDISDEKAPKAVSKLMLEIHDPKNCAQVEPDVVGLTTFTYGSHYCSVDNRDNATVLACSYFNSGIRVFDIRNPERPKEIAYYNPGPASSVPGSNHTTRKQWRAGGPDWCASRLDFDFDKKQLVTMCQDNGLMVMQFADGTWPFKESTRSTSHN